MFKTYVQTIRGFNRNVLLYLFATALIGLSVDGGIYAVIFNLYLLRLGFGPEFIGQVNAAGLVVFALSSLPAGALGGQWGSRRMILVGMSLIVIGGSLAPLAESIAPAAPGPWIMLGYMIMYLGFAVYFANLAPFAIEVSAARDHSHMFSIQAALMALAAFSGSLIAGFLPRLYAMALGIGQNQPSGYRFALFCGAAVLLPALWALWQTRSGKAAEVIAPVEGTTPLQAAPVHSWAGAGSSILMMVIVLSLVRYLQLSSMATAATFFNVYMDTTLQVSTTLIGILSALGRLMGMLAALMTPVLVARLGAPRAVVLASCASALGMLPLAFSPIWQGAGLGFMGVIAASSIRYPALLSYTMDLVPPRWRGAMSGAGEMSAGFSFASMALAGGYLSVAQGYPTFFLLSAALTLVGTLLFWLLFAGAREKRMAASAA